jgi:hypothetical protein
MPNKYIPAVPKWVVTVFDDSTKTFTSRNCHNCGDINKVFGLELTPEMVWRIRTRKRVDESPWDGRKGCKQNNSFLSRYGHIQILKI